LALPQSSSFFFRLIYIYGDERIIYGAERVPPRREAALALAEAEELEEIGC